MARWGSWVAASWGWSLASCSPGTATTSSNWSATPNRRPILSMRRGNGGNVAAWRSSGWAWRTNPLLEAPEPFHGGARPDDGRYEMVTGRRVFVEKVVAELA